MIRRFVNRSLMAAALAAVPVLSANAGPDLIAAASIPATYEDLSNQTAAPLENACRVTASAASAPRSLMREGTPS